MYAESDDVTEVQARFQKEVIGGVAPPIVAQMAKKLGFDRGCYVIGVF